MERQGVRRISRWKLFVGIVSKRSDRSTCRPKEDTRRRRRGRRVVITILSVIAFGTFAKLRLRRQGRIAARRARAQILIVGRVGRIEGPALGFGSAATRDRVGAGTCDGLIRCRCQRPERR